MNTLYLGIDIGSTTVKVVVLDKERHLLADRYLRSSGRPRQTLLRAMDELTQQFDLAQVAGVGLTGSGGDAIARLIGGQHINELIAQSRAVEQWYPQARTVIELGGQDSKFLSLAWDDKGGRLALIDFAMNTLCAAGTGAFLDQQAERLGIAIEGEFATMALQSVNPARIAGRCTVFAKSDMIHLQQQGRPLSDILAGLCLALARNFKSVIGKGKAFVPPILIQGGVAYNRAVVRAFETVLGLAPGELIVPDQHPLMAALGTALLAMDDHAAGKLAPFRGLDLLADDIRANGERKSMPPLRLASHHQARTGNGAAGMPVHTNGGPTTGRFPVYLGIDVGSISTNVVLIDPHARVVARRYLLTAGRPLEAVRRALTEIHAEVGDRVEVCGVGTTGSGRYLTADFVGADVIRNEITAQARAAIAIDPTVETIIEIGGQDSKYIAISHGAIVDFAMNNACAAGTGSFLEEQADRLKIDIKADFSHMALESPCPTCLGERCTVFMESDIVHHQQQGAGVEDLTAGLAYAIAQNYLNRVANGRPIGANVFFQGGVAANRSVVAAFEGLTRRPITVPPHHDVTGAIGAAILAQEAMQQSPDQNGAMALPGTPMPSTRFRGFDLADRHYQASVFECKACTNLCEVSKVVIADEPPIFHGARCDRFEEAGRSRSSARAIPDLFAERGALLMAGYTPPDSPPAGRRRVAMPRVLAFYDIFPYWRAFFDALDIDIVLSEPTNPKIRALSAERAGAETCFPVKLVFGHVLNLLDQEADFIFLPSVVNRENPAPGQTANIYCPFIPASAHLVTAHVDLAAHGHRALKFPLHLLWDTIKRRDLHDLALQLGLPRKRLVAADMAGAEAQQAFYAAVRERGRQVLDTLPPDQTAAVLVGRPYNTCDLSVCQDLPYKLRKLGVLPIPIDYLPLDTVDVSDRYHNMFWRCGQDLLAAATLIRDDPRLQAIYVTSFNCGPDSFIINFFRQMMGDKPFLELELDDHTADAGIVTRCEAFFESLAMGKGGLQ